MEDATWIAPEKEVIWFARISITGAEGNIPS
jgi:hypothetical protein